MSNVIIAIVLFIGVDILIRMTLKKSKENKLKKERALALDSGLKLDFSHEADTLRRVEVDVPKARILCVDDESIILDSFRKILVLAGYSVDTVEQGEEVLRLVRVNHYDFVFVDLKMPGMNGVEVTKAVKHLRPDIDVIIITGYASVETAVETMKHGAMDYVEKPFTEDELLEFTAKCLIKRKDRIKRELGPRVQIAELSEFQHREIDQFSIPGGVFISNSHCWVSLQEDGSARIGIDDFALKLIGTINAVEPPNIGREIKCGDSLFNIRKGQRSIPFQAPISGKILKINKTLLSDLDRLEMSCYGDNWICIVDCDNIDEELKNLKIGKSAVSFFQDQIESCSDQLQSIKDKKKLTGGENGYWWGKIENLDDGDWKQLIKKFF